MAVALGGRSCTKTCAVPGFTDWEKTLVFLERLRFSKGIKRLRYLQQCSYMTLAGICVYTQCCVCSLHAVMGGRSCEYKYDAVRLASLLLLQVSGVLLGDE